MKNKFKGIAQIMLEVQGVFHMREIDKLTLHSSEEAKNTEHFIANELLKHEFRMMFNELASELNATVIGNDYNLRMERVKK